MTSQEEPATVVVGVKHPERSHEAIKLAAREARYRDAALLVITAYGTDTTLGAPGGRPPAVTHDTGEDQFLAESALRDTVAAVLGDQASDVAVQALPGLGGRVLIEAAQRFNAELIVLASRPGKVPSGGVSQYVLRHTPCPVLVVPPAADQAA
jgi:nucleotide-binding universal stress UspA family protein